jgi:preprotein translocase subunit Sec63
MAGYEYDSDGQSVFFILTFLVCVLVPWTYLTFKKDGGESRLGPSAARMLSQDSSWWRQGAAAV